MGEQSSRHSSPTVLFAAQLMAALVFVVIGFALIYWALGPRS